MPEPPPLDPKQTSDFIGELLNQPLADLGDEKSPLFLWMLRQLEPYILPEQAFDMAPPLILHATTNDMPIAEREGALELLEKILPRVYEHDRVDSSSSNHMYLHELIGGGIEHCILTMSDVAKEYGDRVIALIDKYSGLEPLDLSYKLNRPGEEALRDMIAARDRRNEPRH